MARRGFFGRIRDAVSAVRRTIAPTPPPRPEPERGRHEAPQEPTRGGRDPYRQIWRDEDAHKNYRRHLNAFHGLIDPIEDDPEERLALWESYVHYMVKGKGRVRRNSPNNPFWRESGIDPSTFRWDQWRLAMGYTGKRRSRTP